jgi:IS30 family transposase
MDKKIREIQNLINNRPRKVLNFRTLFEVFFDQLFQLEDAPLDALHY